MTFILCHGTKQPKSVMPSHLWGRGQKNWGFKKTRDTDFAIFAIVMLLVSLEAL
jgi:hypothetical protein